MAASYSAISQHVPDEDGPPPGNGSAAGRRLVNRIDGYEGVLSPIRTRRGKKEVGVVGQASWISSVVNLVNTSTSAQPTTQRMVRN